MTDNDDSELLAAGYALGSLTPAETAVYEAYLAGSTARRAEAEEFEAVATSLALGSPAVAPSAALKTRIMAQIAATPQLPAEPAEPDESNAPGPAELRSRSRWTRRPTIILAAAAAAIVSKAGPG